MPTQTREPALVDDGIPGGPGVYSTRCPPLPRLRLTESREVVRRAALRAKGVDPDLVERCVTPTAKNKHERNERTADSAGDSPVGTTKPSPRAADPLADLVDGADALFDLPEGRKRDRGGGGGGDFSVGARADHHLRTMHDVRRVRAERRALRTLLPPGKRRGIRAGEGRDDATTNVPSSSSSNPGVEGTYSSKSTVWNRGADRVVADRGEAPVVRLDRVLVDEAGVELIQVNPATGRAILRWQRQTVALSTLLRRIAQLGYRPHLLSADQASGILGVVSTTAGLLGLILLLLCACLGLRLRKPDTVTADAGSNRKGGCGRSRPYPQNVCAAGRPSKQH